MAEGFSGLFARLKRERRKALIPFVVPGYPSLEASLELARELGKEGADALEIGVPFSDPIADGKTIQGATQKALGNGMTSETVFSFVGELRKSFGEPIGLLAYANSVVRMGTRDFFVKAKKAGVSAVLLADVPLEEAGLFREQALGAGLEFPLFLAPTTPMKRMKLIDREASGFLYAVSTLGVTGVRRELRKESLALAARVKENCVNPVAVGFGISSGKQANAVVEAGADGVIIGSALIAAERPLELFREMKKAVDGIRTGNLLTST